MTNLEITNAYVGDTQIAKIYLGTDVVWLPEYYVEEDNGTMHGLYPSPHLPGPIADFEMDHNGSFTLYHNGEVLTAQSAVCQVVEWCGEELIQLKEQQFLDDYAVQNVCAGCQYPTSTGKKRMIIGYTGGYGDDTLVVEANIFYCSGSPAPSYIEFNEWYSQGSNSRTLGHVLLIKQGSTIWTTPGDLGYLADSYVTDTGSSHYVIEIQRGAPAQMPLRYHNTGTTTWSFLMPNSTETIDGVTYDRYDLPTNVYLGLNKSFFASSVPQDSLYIFP